MSLEHSFSDCAYAGMQPGNTDAASLAYLGIADGSKGEGYSFLDSAYLGLHPGRATARRSAFIGLFDRASVSPPPAPAPPVFGGGKRRKFGVQKLPEIPVPSKNRQELEEELILMYYHNNFFWE